jgi:hypothetical protein
MYRHSDQHGGNSLFWRDLAGCKCLKLLAVAVATSITDRPPHRTGRARLRIKCARTHLMRYVAAKLMWRPAFTAVEISEPVNLDTT